MKKIKLFCLILLTGGFILSCDSNDDNNSGNNSDESFSENFGSSVSRDFAGQVVDINGQPLAGTTVTIGSATIQTDANGVFMINDASVKEKFAFVKVKKAGFIDGSRTMVPTSGINNIKIMLIAGTPLETIQSGQSGEVALPSGTMVKFDGAFEDANGNAYNGDVTVAMFHLESSNENISQLMPGSLYADDNGEEAVLETFGMLNVELRGSSGQELQIAGGHTAEISMVIDSSQLASAPATMPLWHFDEELGYWKQEGTATKSGNMYKGEVSHFSWWNCDIPWSTILVTFNVVDYQGNPLPNAYVNIDYAGYHATGTTDSNGQLSGLVPANAVLDLNIHQFGICGPDSVFNGQIGPFTADTVLPNFVVNDAESVFISGMLLQCDNTPVTNGYVVLTYDNLPNHISFVADGYFIFPFGSCGISDSTEFSVEGFDYNNLQTTGSITYNLISPATDVGPIIACTLINEFLTYQIDDNEVQTFVSGFDVSGYSNGEPGFYITGFGSQQQSIYLISNVSTVGSYNTNNFTVTGTGIYLGPQLTNTVQMNVNALGNVGEYIDLTLSGTYTDSTGVHTISGAAHVIRDF